MNTQSVIRLNIEKFGNKDRDTADMFLTVWHNMPNDMRWVLNRIIDCKNAEKTYCLLQAEICSTEVLDKIKKLGINGLNRM